VRLWLRHWWPAAAWATAIFIFSTGHFAGDRTGAFLVPLIRWLLPDASPAEIVSAHYWIRKAGHVFVYFVLSLLVFRGVRGERTGCRLRWVFEAWLIASAYAVSDELHQWFVPGRGASVADVLIDSAAAAVAQLVAAIMWRGRTSSG
jgi:VanZ family protein